MSHANAIIRSIRSLNPLTAIAVPPILKHKNPIDETPQLFYHADMTFARLADLVRDEGHVMDEERYWQAVLARETSMDGAFVYAVRSTGIFCRPVCPSRRPNREQVVFFAQPSAAEQAGFRACRR